MSIADVLPGAFTDRMKHQLGEDFEAFLSALESPSPTSIRMHHLKGRTSDKPARQVPWCPSGYYLDKRPPFHIDPHWHAGAYYVQEASSMFLDHILASLELDARPRTWVDLCAAPGGKTGILARHMQASDILVANEVVAQRRAVLRENLTKAGLVNTFITGEPASSFARLPSDILLVDAPCAGEGMMRKDAEAIRQWTPELVTSCSLMQRQIIHDSIQGLKQDGYLIYSTCSYSMEENIFNVRHYADAYDMEPVAISIPSGWGIQNVEAGNAQGYQLYPHHVSGEGLFFAVLKQTKNHIHQSRKSKQGLSAFGSIPVDILTKIEGIDSYVGLKQHPACPVVTASSAPLANDVLAAFARAELISETMELKGRDLIPCHFLAMAEGLNPVFEHIDLDYEQALSYLERNTNTLPPSGEHGWYLIRFQESRLGWAKRTQQGWKNYYPMPWRLRDRRIK